MNIFGEVGYNWCRCTCCETLYGCTLRLLRPRLLPQLRRVPKTDLRQNTRIPIPARHAPFHRDPDLLDFLLAQIHLQRTQVLLEVLDLLRPRDRNHILPLRHQPRQRQLPHRAALPPRNRTQLPHQLEVFREILLGEPRHASPAVVRVEVLGAFVPSRQHAAAERAVGDGRDAERAARGEEVGTGGLLDVEGEGGVFDLGGEDGVDGGGAAEGRGGAFGEAEVVNLF